MGTNFEESISNTVVYNVFDYKKLYYRIKRNWLWFTFSVVLGLFFAWFANTFLPSRFDIRSSLIVNEYESGIKRLSLSDNVRNDKNVNVLGQDHAGRIKSFALSLISLEELQWEVSWYQKTLLYGKDLYGEEPFKVKCLPNKANLQGIPIFFQMLDGQKYVIQVDGDILINNMKRTIRFKQNGILGEPFENEYFAFIIEDPNMRVNNNEHLYFVINNLNDLALKYQKNLKIISNEKKPDLIEIVLVDRNCKRGVDFLNTLGERYIEFGLEEKNRVAENTMKFIDNQLKSISDSLYYSENRFSSFRSRNQAVDLAQSGGLALQKQEALESERADLERRLGYLNNLKKVMSNAQQIKEVMVPSSYGITEPSINSLLTKLIELYGRREVMSFSVQEKAPSLVVLDREIQLTKDLLTQNINNLLAVTEVDLENLIRRVGGFSTQLSILPRTDQQLNALKRSFDLNNELYTFLLKMRAESAITYASNQPDVKVLDQARIETSKQTSPMSLFNYIVGILMGCFIPVSIFLLKDIVGGTIQTKEEVTEFTKLPIAGIIIHNKNKNDLVVFENPQSNISESFRILRTNLKYILGGKERKVIAVQSTVAGEGKSFVSLNLATILAMNNLSILLISVDMRMSNLHTILKSNNKKGLSTYLSAQDNFEDVIQSTSVTNLSYISSGPVPPNPAELLEGGYFDRLIAEAKLRYDYIVLDSPPVSLVADGIITGSHADLNIFVVRLRYSSKEHLAIIRDHESKKSIPNLAIVLNDAVKEDLWNGNYYNSRNKGYYRE